MSRILPPLAIVSVLLMLTAFGLGWMIEDAGSTDPRVADQVRWHFFAGLGALVFVSLVHSIVLTYFMGTGRWIEETSRAYGLSDEFFVASRRLKYRTIPLMVLGILSLVVTGAFGAVADPASRSSFAGWFGMTPAQVHFAVASAALMLNVLIEGVLAEVHRIRTERGLPTVPRPGTAPAHAGATTP